MTKRKILHVITGLKSGGAEAMLLKLVTATDNTRFTSEIISLSGPGEYQKSFESLGVRVYTFNLKRLFGILHFLIHAPLLVLRSKPDLIQGWMYHGNLVAWFLRFWTLNRVPLAWNVRVSTEHFHSYSFLTKLVVRLGGLLSRYPDVILNNSLDSISKHVRFGFQAEKSLYVPNGFDTEKFKPEVRNRVAIRQSLEIPEDATVVGYFANFLPKKNHSGFLSAMALLRIKHPNVHVLLAGRGVVHENVELSKKISRLDLSENVHLLGYQSNMPDLYRCLDIYIHASLTEGFSNSIGEACSSALPCIATEVGDAKPILDGIGFTVPVGDEASLVKVCDEVLSKAPDERELLGQAARNRIINEYRIPSITKKYEEIYEKLILEINDKPFQTL